MDIESIQVHLNSKYASSYNNGNLSDCTFILPYVEIPSQRHIYLSVVHAVIPYSMYNIDSTNNLLSYSVNGGISTNLYITAGNYTSSQLVAFMNSQMTNFVVTYSSITNTFSWTHSTYNFIFNTNSTCFDLIGFSLTSNLSSSSRTITSPYCVNMARFQCICIGSNVQTSSMNLNPNQSNCRSIIASIPLDNQPFSSIIYKNENQFKVNLYSNNLTNINIKLMDQDGNMLNLNGKYFSLTLQLDIVDFV